MPRLVRELSDLQVRRLRHGVSNGKPVKVLHAVGGVAGLLLQCTPPKPGYEIGGRSWILRTTVGDRRRDLGVGGYPEVTLSMARDKARELKELVRQGIDPVSQKQARKSAIIREQSKGVNFKDLAAEYIAKKARELKTAKQVQKLTNHLENYVYPSLGRMVVADIERAHVVAVLQPIWESKNETASRVRTSIERILDLATVKGLRRGDNPARWKGNLELSFAARQKVAKVRHYAALPVDDLPAFMAKLRVKETVAAKALYFAILTAARSGEVRGATWDEIDFKNSLWTIPAERMKAGKIHRVPLSDAAIKLLQTVPRLGEHIFIGVRGKPIQDSPISKAPKLVGYDVTAHGFRSTFKDWCRRFTSYADEISELALAHVNSDATRAAYARDELLDKRRQLMADWDRFCHLGVNVSAKGTVTAIGNLKQDGL